MDIWSLCDWFNQIIGAIAYYALILAIAVPLTLTWRTPYVIASLYVASYVIS